MTSDFKAFRQRDIVLIPISYTDMTATKHRPALVISSDDYNQKGTDILAVMITSTQNRMPYDVAILAQDMEQGETPRPSFVRCDRIFSVAQSLIVRQFGRVTEGLHTKVQAKINTLIEGNS